MKSCILFMFLLLCLASTLVAQEPTKSAQEEKAMAVEAIATTKALRTSDVSAANSLSAVYRKPNARIRQALQFKMKRRHKHLA